MTTFGLYKAALRRLSEVYYFGELGLLQQFPDGDQQPVFAEGAVARIELINDDDLRLAPGVEFQGNITISTQGRGNLVCIGSGTALIHSHIRVKGNGCVVVIGEGCRLKQLQIIVSNDNSMVFIGSDTTWESGSILSGRGNLVAVGNDCMASTSVVIRSSDGHSIFDRESGVRVNDPADVLIGHHVWLCNSSRVNKGTSIGTGTVLGQCAIASGKLDAAAVYAGMPARKLKEGVVWSRTHFYEDIPERYR